MDFFQTFAFARRPAAGRRGRRSAKARGEPAPKVEALEERWLLDCASISGFVYHDLNHSGVYDANEATIPNSPVELHDAAGNLVARTTTDAQGAYRFDTDPRIDTTPATRTYQIGFPTQATNWVNTQPVPQFDPALGTLTAVDLLANDTVATQVRVENLDTSPATIRAGVNANVSLLGPGLPPVVSDFAVQHSFDAAAFDGRIDFDGPSGHTFPLDSAPHSHSQTLTTAAQLAPFLGSGNVTFAEEARATATADGSANVVLAVTTTASGQLTVVYHYIPANCLPSADYLIVQPANPPGFLPGLKTSGNLQPIPGSADTNFIRVHLGTTSLIQNNFGEVQPAGVSGFVYHDRNNNGVKEAGEEGVAGVAITLTGIDDLGRPVTQAQATLADGSYQFANLRPGVYTITKTPPAGWLEGKDTIGTPGGIVEKDIFHNVNLQDGVSGVNNNFGELKPATLSGFVYLDPDNNGVKEPGEKGIGGVRVTLTGVDDYGAPIVMSQLTADDGSYSFGGLRPGTYAITETHPDGYIDGIDTIGTQGGKTTPLMFSDITATSGLVGTDNDFAELLPSTVNRGVPQPPTNPSVPLASVTPAPGVGKQFFLGYRSPRT